MKHVFTFLFFLLVFFSHGVSAQEIAETDIIMNTKERCYNLAVTDCGDVYVTCKDSIVRKDFIAKYDPVSKSMRRLELPAEMQWLDFTNFGKHPHTGDLYAGYQGGYIVTRDCGQTWEFGHENAPTSDYSTIAFDGAGRMFVGSTGGTDVLAYWTEDYEVWNPFCYDAFAYMIFDVSPDGTIITIEQDSEAMMYRVTENDSCERLMRSSDLPEQGQARLDDVYSPRNDVWILTGAREHNFVSYEDGDVGTWIPRLTQMNVIMEIDRASASFDIGCGAVWFDKAGFILSRDELKTSLAYGVEVDFGLARTAAIDSSGHIWLLIETADGREELHRTKESFFSIVSTPREEPTHSASSVEVRDKSVVLTRPETPATVRVYDVTGRLVLHKQLTGLDPELDCWSLSGTYFLVAENERTNTTEHHRVWFH